MTVLIDHSIAHRMTELGPAPFNNDILGPILNFDVLLHIIDQSESQKSKLAMMSTCRLLYREGVKTLLRGQVVLGLSQKQLKSFLSFLLKEPNVRYRRLRDLRLDTYDLSSRLAQKFGSVCPMMTSLERLEMGYPETMLLSHPAVMKGLAQLKSLKHLKLASAGEKVHKLLKLLHAPLQTLSVCWIPDVPIDDSFWDNIDTEYWPHCHSTILLENFADTLEELTCQWWHMPEQYLPPRKTYPRMRRLSIESVNFRFIFNLAPFIRAFPNLTNLLVETHLGEYGSMNDEMLQIFRDSHLFNVVEQNRAPSDGYAWRCIQEFSGSFVDLYFFGLACPVNRLVLKDSSDTTQIPFPADVLSFTRPTYLEYTTYIYDDFDSGLGLLSSGLREAKPVALARLKTLFIRFWFACSDPDSHFPDAMVRRAFTLLFHILTAA